MSVSHHFPRLFDTELFLVAAKARSDFLATLDMLENYLSQPNCASLQDIAFTVSRSYEKGMRCLSIVASSHDDLRKKLVYARDKLKNENNAKINEKAGIYYFEKRFGLEKLAFLLPGENAQYVNMLRDLCLHFPEVRHAFDNADAACAQVGDGFTPSELNFPPEVDLSSENTDELAKWEKAIALVHTANTAMIEILEQLEVRPDAVLGHSFGELSALEMAGVLRPGSGQERIQFLSDQYINIKDLADNTDLPQGILVTVGGAKQSQIEHVISRFPDTLCIAMENCPHQYVLCASGEKMDSVIQKTEEWLTNEGAICSRLPINRPYHTRFFEPAFPLQREYLAKVGVHLPQIDIYSCASTDRFPNDLEAIIDLSAKYWMSPVRFEKTIERMYDDGIRIFVEAGPRGNLCAFVNDILKGKPHLAVAVNRPHRSDITQLHHALGLLAAHGVHMSLDYLHTGWGSQMVGLSQTDTPDADKESRIVPLPIFLPQMKADEILKKRGLPRVKPKITPRIDVRLGKTKVENNPDDQVMKAYLNTMDQFLASQREVMAELLNPATSCSLKSKTPTPSATAPLQSREQPVRSFPLLGQIIEMVPERSLVALRTVDVEEDLYLNDHSLGTTVSATDPTLKALPVMPLLISLEIAAEAGAALFPRKKVVAIEDIHANRWIFFEERNFTLRTIAQRLEGNGGFIHVRVSLKEENDSDPRAKFRPSMVEATAVLADDYPPSPLSRAGRLTRPLACNWSGSEIYPKRTFHGPLFQGIQAIEQIAEDGLDGRIEVLSSSRLFRSDPDPDLVFDPLLVDCMGQAVWLWGSKELFNGRAYLPYGAKALRFFGRKLPPKTPLTFNLRVRSRNDMNVVTDIESIDHNGIVQVVIEGMVDRDFYISSALHRLIMEPVENTFADIWEPPLPAGSHQNGRLSFSMIAGFPTEILEGGYGVWRKALAFLILNPPEREQWKALKGSLKREIQWLLGRAAVKDVVRHHILKTTGQKLGAADICIETDNQNKPFVSGAWKSKLSLIPQISITHTEGMVAAVCGDGKKDFGLGIDTEAVRDPAPDFVEGSFTSEELNLLCSDISEHDRPEWIFRLWCAKEAVSKALESGLRYDPRELSVKAIGLGDGRVTLSPKGEWIRHMPQIAKEQLVAVTFRKNDHVFGVCTYTKKGEL